MDTKTDSPGFYKSPEGYIINKDNEALQIYKARKNREKNISNIQEEMQNLKSDISEIKELLKGLVR